MTSIPVPREHVHRIWSLVEDHINAALAHAGPEWAEEVVLAKLLSGTMQLWVCEEAGRVVSATTTQVSDGRLEICQHGGTQDTWTEGLVVLEEYARQHGCTSLRIMGRPGWGRKLKDFKLQYTVFDKRLD